MNVVGKVKATGGKKCFAWFVFEHGWRGPPQVSLLLKPAGAGKGMGGCDG